MKYIVVDLEMNPIPEDPEKKNAVCKNEIIQIGAVCLNENFEEIGYFSSYVCPRVNPTVTKYIQKLTHITTEMLKDAPDFHRAMMMFFDWCGSFEGDIQLMQWSKNDYYQIQKEMILQEYVPRRSEIRFIETEWEDLQDQFDRVIGFERLQSLSAALRLAGLDFEGSQHDALDDARNEARLLKALNKPEEYQEHIYTVAKAMEETTFTFADMFDLSNLSLSA